MATNMNANQIFMLNVFDRFTALRAHRLDFSDAESTTYERLMDQICRELSGYPTGSKRIDPETENIVERLLDGREG